MENCRTAGKTADCRMFRGIQTAAGISPSLALSIWQNNVILRTMPRSWEAGLGGLYLSATTAWAWAWANQMKTLKLTKQWNVQGLNIDCLFNLHDRQTDSQSLKRSRRRDNTYHSTSFFFLKHDFIWIFLFHIKYHFNFETLIRLDQTKHMVYIVWFNLWITLNKAGANLF